MLIDVITRLEAEVVELDSRKVSLPNDLKLSLIKSSGGQYLIELGTLRIKRLLSSKYTVEQAVDEYTKIITAFKNGNYILRVDEKFEAEFEIID